MKLIKNIGLSLLTVALFAFFTFKIGDTVTEKRKFKCLVQLSNYEGEGAYVVVSLVNPQGEYEETLYMFGPEERWWEEFKIWWPFHQESGQDLDGITGESIAGGERKITTLEIPKDKMDQGYTLRFESSVEDQDYFNKDIDLPLATSSMKKKVKGTGYIRYVRLLPQK